MEEYVQYWAWLTTARKGSTTARLESLVDVQMPDVEPFEYMIPLIAEIGLNGVTWSEINHWMQLTGVQLRLWEIKQIKKLSMMYRNYSQQYEGSSIPAPYRDFEAPQGMSQSTRDQIRNDRR